MSKIIRLVKNDFKNVLRSKGFCLAFLLTFMYISIWIVRSPKSFSAEDYQFEFFRVVNFIIIYYSSTLLGSEFKLGTAKILFSGILTHIQVVIEKLFVTLMIGAFFWMCSRILNVFVLYRLNGYLDISYIFNINTFNSLIIYLVISFVIGSFCLFTTVVTRNLIGTLVAAVSIFGILQYFTPIFVLLNSEEYYLSIAAKIINKLPNYIIFNWVESWMFTNMQIVYLAIYGSVFLIFSFFIIDRRSII